MKLSERLAAIAALVPEGAVVADIGTDHAHLPIWLVQQARAPQAIAMDVAEGPLARAREAVRDAGLEGQIQTRLSDGFAALNPGEATCAVIAGMGGDLMLRILREGQEIVRSLDALVLSPQAEIARVRAFLRENGLKTQAEDMVLEDGKYYQMLRVLPAKDSGRGCGGEADRRPERLAQAVEDRYGPCLLRARHPVLLQYLRWERQIKENILGQLAGSGGEGARRREQEVHAQLRLNEAALKMMMQTEAAGTAGAGSQEGAGDTCMDVRDRERDG